MDNNVINKKAEIAEIVNMFKQNLDFKSDEINERRFLKNVLKEMKK